MAHRYIIGMAGTGKTSLLRQLILEDESPGICVFDTKGDLTIPHNILFDPSTIRWNPLAEKIDPNLAPTFFASAVKDAYGYDDLTTPVMSMYLSFLAAAIIENKRNLTNIPQFLTDQRFRKQYSYANPLVKQFWKTYDNLSEKDQRQETASTLNKFLALLLDQRIHKMLSVNKPRLSLGDVSDKVMLVRLPASEYGKETASLLGSLILTYLSQQVQDYSIYVEDCDLFARGTLKELLSRSRVSLTLSSQYIDQTDPALFAAMQGNCSERFIFRVSQADSDVLARDLPPMSSKAELDQLPNFRYRRLPYDKSPDGITIPLEISDATV